MRTPPLGRTAVLSPSDVTRYSPPPAFETLEPRLLLSLLGVATEYPAVNYDSTGVVNYSAATDAFQSTATPISIVAAKGQRPIAIGVPDDFFLGCQVNNAGTLTGGVAGNDLVVDGKVTISGTLYSGVLLTGEIMQFGYQDSGGPTDLYDFRFHATGGALLALAGFNGKDIGVVMTSVSSTFDDTGGLGFTRDFHGGSQGYIAPIEPLPTLTVGLVQDTGASDSDRITSNGALAGKVGTTVGASLLAAVDNGAWAPVTLAPDGSYTFGPSLLDGAHTVHLKATDILGFSVTSDFSFTLDATAPTIIAVRDGLDYAAAHSGWNNTDVTASYTASDALSGLVTPASGSQVFSTEGPGQSATFSATDLAGNSATASVLGINIDKTAPTITGAADRPANAAGWYNADVTVSFTGGDDLSGVATLSGPTVLGEGAGQGVTGTVTDLAGNSAQATVAGINIDETAPTITGSADRPANAAGWYNADVTVSFTGGDDLSGVATLSGPTVLGEGADQGVTGTVTDLAGNSAQATVAGINIDETAPTITGSPDRPANAAGWYNADVTVSFTGGDDLSGVASITGPTVLGEGAGQSVLGTVTDLAGNSAQATVAGINIDETPPVVTLTNAGTYLLGTPVAWSVVDQAGLSGMATTTVTLDGNVVSGAAAGSLALIAGSHTVVVAGQDLAGNAAVPETRTFFGANPGIAINKVTMDGTRVGDDASMTIVVGTPIVWQYTVTNLGNVALSAVQVTDNQAGVTPAYVSGDTNSNGKLDTNETWIFKASGTAVLGAQSNIGTALAAFTDSAGQTAAPTASDASGYTGIVYTPPPSSSLSGIVWIDYNNDGLFQGGCYQWGSGCFDRNWTGCGQSGDDGGSGWWKGGCGSDSGHFFGWNSCPWSSDWKVGKDVIKAFSDACGWQGSLDDFGDQESASVLWSMWHDADNTHCAGANWFSNFWSECYLDGGQVRLQERGLAGVTVTLTGTNILGQAVTQTTTTNACGAYQFANLLPGTYTLTETQPSGYLDGKDTIGTLGGTAGNDTFVVTVTGGQQGKNYNFGEFAPPASPG